MQLYESTPAAVKSEIGTFFEVFPNGVIWGNTHQGAGTHGPHGDGRSAALQRRRVGRAPQQPGGTRAVKQIALRRSASTPRSIFRQLRGTRVDWAPIWPTRRSIMIAIYGCSISLGWG